MRSKVCKRLTGPSPIVNNGGQEQSAVSRAMDHAAAHCPRPCTTVALAYCLPHNSLIPVSSATHTRRQQSKCCLRRLHGARRQAKFKVSNTVKCGNKGAGSLKKQNQCLRSSNRPKLDSPRASGTTNDSASKPCPWIRPTLLLPGCKPCNHARHPPRNQHVCL